MNIVIHIITYKITTVLDTHPIRILILLYYENNLYYSCRIFDNRGFVVYENIFIYN